MRKYLFFLALHFLINNNSLLPQWSQSNQWLTFVGESGIHSLASEGKFLWIGAENYLVRLNTATVEKDYFLIGQDIISLAIDQKKDKWVGLWSGLEKFDGSPGLTSEPLNPPFLLYQSQQIKKGMYGSVHIMN